MNSRIEELANDSFAYAQTRHSQHSPELIRTFTSKFAELLIRDVMETRNMGESDREHLCSYYGLEYKPVMMKHPEYGDLYQLDEWDEAVNAGYFNSDDGSGYWATKTEYAHVSCWDECPEWATHILWFNK